MSYYSRPSRQFSQRSSRRPSFNRGRGQQQKTVDVNYLIRKAEEANHQSQLAEPTVEPVIQHTFGDFPVSAWLQRSIVERGYDQPTPIQDQTIPLLLEGRDVVGIANTGTGKTAAFLIPLLHKISLDRSQKALIIAPTRELAAQIKDEVFAFTQHFRFQTVLCIGGASMNRQIDALRRRPDIVIGTPGRLKDLYQQRQLDFSQFSSIVLDEVDRMLDMGFIRDIDFIVSMLPKDRQSIFFSATLSPEVRQVMNGFLRDPAVISVKAQETSLNVEQKIVRTGGRNKVEVLYEILREETVTKTIVFGRTKRGVEKLSRELYQRGFAVEALHGNKSQNQRLRALDLFKSNRVSVLLATDVAARGLDISDVSHVINYDLPATYEDYVHRIGRTGRAQNKGVAVSLVE